MNKSFYYTLTAFLDLKSIERQKTDTQMSQLPMPCPWRCFPRGRPVNRRPSGRDPSPLGPRQVCHWSEWRHSSSSQKDGWGTRSQGERLQPGSCVMLYWMCHLAKVFQPWTPALSVLGTGIYVFRLCAVGISIISCSFRTRRRCIEDCFWLVGHCLCHLWAAHSIASSGESKCIHVEISERHPVFPTTCSNFKMLSNNDRSIWEYPFLDNVGSSYVILYYFS